MVVAQLTRLHVHHQRLGIGHRAIGIVPEVHQVHIASGGVGNREGQAVLPEGRVVGRDGGAAGGLALAGSSQKGIEKVGIKEQVVAIDQARLVNLRQAGARRQFHLICGNASQQIALMQPEGLVLDAQVARSFVEGSQISGALQDDF